MDVKSIKGTFACEDCGFYNDCPIDYCCPPMKILSMTVMHPDCYEFAIDGIKWKREEEE